MCTSAVAVERTASGRDADALVVAPATVAHLAALIDGDRQFERYFGIKVVPGYLEFDGALRHALDQVTTGGVDPRWMTHLFVDRDEFALVGLGGFKGAPVEGVVEIGYGIAPSHRGRGLATAAARALVELARRRDVATVRAHTLAEPNASTGVLQNVAFVRTGELHDSDVGAIWRWELDLTG
jgi:RimJ/RimL family protein N-acetyltransferase